MSEDVAVVDELAGEIEEAGADHHLAPRRNRNGVFVVGRLRFPVDGRKTKPRGLGIPLAARAMPSGIAPATGVLS